MFFFFFFNDTATTEIYTLSLHDALPIFLLGARERIDAAAFWLNEGATASDIEKRLRSGDSV